MRVADARQNDARTRHPRIGRTRGPGRRREADLTSLINIVFLILIFFVVAGAIRPFAARDIDLAKVARQDVGALHRQHLAHFHRRAAHAGQPLGQFFGVGGGQKHVDGVVGGGANQAPCALEYASYRKLAGGESELHQAPDAGSGYA